VSGNGLWKGKNRIKAKTETGKGGQDETGAGKLVRSAVHLWYGTGQRKPKSRKRTLSSRRGGGAGVRSGRTGCPDHGCRKTAVQPPVLAPDRPAEHRRVGRRTGCSSLRSARSRDRLRTRSRTGCVALHSGLDELRDVPERRANSPHSGRIQ